MLRLEDKYANSVPASVDYPGGSVKNSSTPTGTDGTPVDDDWLNDIIGSFYAIIGAAGVAPSGVPDTAVASDVMDSLRLMFPAPYVDYFNYPINTRVIGSDGLLYIALVANGPASTVVEPVDDITDTWVSDNNSLSNGNTFPMTTQSGAKVVAREATNDWWVVAPKDGGIGYTRTKVSRGVVTASGSLGGDAELARVVAVDSAVGAWFGRHAYSGVNNIGNWTDDDYSVAGTSSKEFVLADCAKHWSTTTNGEWMEFAARVPESGEFTLQFRTTAGSADDVTISIDGVAVASNISLVNNIDSIYRMKLNAVPGFRTVRVTKNSAIGNLYIFGTNYHDVREYTDLVDLNGLTVFLDGTGYLSENSAEDYAFLETNSGKFGGSFHGGETLLEGEVVIDGIKSEFGLAVGAVKACRKVEFRQATLIDWSGSGGGTLNVYSTLTFAGDSSYSFTASIDGDIDIDTGYTCMTAAKERFTDVVGGKKVDLTGVGDGNHDLNKCTVVTIQDPLTGERITSGVEVNYGNQWHKTFKGPMVRKTTGSNNKLYYGPSISDTGKYLGSSFTAVKVFN